MTKFQWFVALVLTTASTPALFAAAHCPGNVESVPLRLVNSYQMIVSVSINGSGPYDFLLDTGSEFTVIDRSLASELQLPLSGKAAVVGAGVRASADFSRVESMAIGSQALENQTAVVYDLPGFAGSQSKIRGILGESFLSHFEALIDIAHLHICLDHTSTLGSAVSGERIPLVASNNPGSDDTLPGALVVSARLSDGTRSVRLKLDSGTNQAFLYNAERIMDLRYYRGTVLNGSAIDGHSRSFMALPQQDVRIGSLVLSSVPFFTLVGVNKDSRTPDFDGLLAFNSFKRVFISHSNHYVILEPR
jgi:hypothetical protein